jgi:ketosteroid isomerase-like protein
MSREAEVLAAAAELVRAFGAHDTDDYFAQFTDDATFVFYTHPTLLGSRREYEQLWAEWERDAGFRVHSCRSSAAAAHLVSPDVAIFTHDVETDLSLGGERSVTREQETIVFRDFDGGWLAVHEHLSPRT